MQKHTTLHLVKSEDLNHHGTLFAARTAAWVVEAGFAAAAVEHGDTAEILCRNMHGLVFNFPMHLGDVVACESRVVAAGRTSLVVQVTVKSAMRDSGCAVEAFLTFVAIDQETGKPKPHGVTLDDPADATEAAAREAAQALRK